MSAACEPLNSALVIYVSKLPLGVRFGPVPLASCGNGLGVNSPTAVSFAVLSQTPRRPSYFQNSIIACAMLIYFGYWIASKSEKTY